MGGRQLGLVAETPTSGWSYPASVSLLTPRLRWRTEDQIPFLNCLLTADAQSSCVQLTVHLSTAVIVPGVDHISLVAKPYLAGITNGGCALLY